MKLTTLVAFEMSCTQPWIGINIFHGRNKIIIAKSVMPPPIPMMADRVAVKNAAIDKTVICVKQDFPGYIVSFLNPASAQTIYPCPVGFRQPE